MVCLPEPTCPYQQIPCASVHAGDIEPLDMFFAYASEPQRRVDAIRGAIEIIQGDSALGCKIADWTDLPIEGNVIFCAICEAIRNARCVATDITGLNFNVLFELGFAIGAGRAIWPLVESSEEERLYVTFDTLTTVGHSRYTNSKSNCLGPVGPAAAGGPEASGRVRKSPMSCPRGAWTPCAAGGGGPRPPVPRS